MVRVAHTPTQRTSSAVDIKPATAEARAVHTRTQYSENNRMMVSQSGTTYKQN